MMVELRQAKQMLSELKEFARFSAAEQKYIRASLDVAFGRGDAHECRARYPREAELLGEQRLAYRTLEKIRSSIPDDHQRDRVGQLMAPLIMISVHDLSHGKIASFSAYRFLYERLLGPAIRPWLPSAFCAAATLPHVHPQDRRVLLEAIPHEEASAAGWSSRASAFYPQWVEKVPATFD